MNRIYLPLALVAGIFCYTFTAQGSNIGLDDPYSVANLATVADTIPPPGERYGDFLNDQQTNPFDLEDPSVVEQNVEFDPATGNYIITEKIGDNYFRPPTYMTFDEYLEYQRQKEERDYFNQLAGINTGENGLSSLDPISKIDVKNSLLDRLFGGTKVDIRPQGNIDLTFGVDYQKLDNPILTERQRRNANFDFDMNIQMNVTGKIGEKLNLTTNYNTNATFNFDNVIKLDYNSDLYGEDDILKRIEAGNVSLPLRGTLIQGAQSLFGLKTELQFGHLRLTAIASQQRSQRENIRLEGGSQKQEFEVRADEYDENRHFFLSHYFRENYEDALANLPYIKTLSRITDVEVWVTVNRNDVNVESIRDIVAFADLGEPERLVNPDAVTAPTIPVNRDFQGKGLPANNANDLYERLINRPGLKDVDRVVSLLQSSEFGLVQGRDFEKVSARRLRSTEYTYNAELGFISLNVNVQPDQVVAVSYAYEYNGGPPYYAVGDGASNENDNSTDTTDLTPQVMFVKMLKSTAQPVNVPTWDLMMKNVYSIGAYQVESQDFLLDIFYDDPGKGLKRFLPTSNLAGEPLLRVFNLDRLNTYGDPQPDGRFDFVPGTTINPTNGRIYFPVLEPFGSSLAAQLDDQFEDDYVYQELYDETLFNAIENAEKNRFIIKGSYESSVSSEISLGAFNIPENSETVTAGGTLLQRGQDYEIDYSTGRLRILNDAILASGVPINVSFEDNTLFGFQQKTMVGLRADYEVSKDINVGATFLQLYERPFTPKVNIGEDPINNKIYGLDLNLSKEAPWLTRAVDALPLVSTSAPSSINFSAEAAYLKPGHARAINESKKDKSGTVYIDDFEGAASSFDLRTPVNGINGWALASVPQNDDANNNPLFPEATVDNLAYGANRALLNWYRIDPSARGPRDGDRGDPYTSLVPQEEVFPNRQLTPEQLPNIQTLDLSFFPQQRGPYNFDTPDGYPGYTRGVSINGSELVLNDPATRWGGIMRQMNTPDFQTANIEFLEFWMLSPFLDTLDATSAAPDAELRQGKLYINLGNVSEDILKDSRKFFENGLPTTENPNRRTDNTSWARVPVGQQITNSFDLGDEARNQQDVGLDGLNDDAEAAKFSDYIQAIQAVNPNVAAEIAKDPSNDNFYYYRDDQRFGPDDGVRQRYKFFNNPEGNSQSNTGNSVRNSNSNFPDSEDINRDNSLNETESYFQYEIPLEVDPMDRREIDLSKTTYITDRIEDEGTGRIWYRFRVPLNGDQKKAVGGIQDFRSIRFMRMYLRGFEAPVTLRFASLELVRNQWRRYTQSLETVDAVEPCTEDATIDIDAVNIEENSNREPFNYTLPIGIQREQSLGVFTTQQNEKALALRVNSLCDGASQGVFKIIETDMRVYERFKMFVHAEERAIQEPGVTEIPDGALSIFVRLGSDFQNNYYEYEIPLVMSDPDAVMELDAQLDEYKQEVWKEENSFDFELALLRQLKEERNNGGFDVGREYTKTIDPGTGGQPQTIKVKGNPNLGFVKIAFIGIRNPADGIPDAYSAEIWTNEMRLTGLDERGAAAALARMDIQLADLGTVSLAGNVSSVGFGALDDGVQDRAREQVAGYDMAVDLNLDKFLPEKWGIKLPFYGQISNVTKTPEYDPYDLDIKLKDKLAAADNKTERDSIKEQAQEVVNIRAFNFTDVRKERTGGSGGAGAKPTPLDIENFSVSYAYSETERSDPIIASEKEQLQKASVDYGFSRSPKYIEPLKGLKKNKFLRLLGEFNFNPLPNSFTASSFMERRFITTSYRFTGLEERFRTYYAKYFKWDRDYNLQWDLSKALKFNYNALASSIIDEPDERRIRDDATIEDVNQYRKDSIWSNIKKLGRPKLYNHSLSANYTLPIRYLPFMDWVNIRAQYSAEYAWEAASLVVDSLGNVIRNSQNRQINADLNFEKLYDQFDYLKKINRPARRNTKGRGATRNSRDKQDLSDKATDDKKKKKKNPEPSVLERALIRPLMLVRRARFNYTERFQTVIPGFTPRPSLLGMESGFGAPGLDFAAGLQPKIRELTDAQQYTSEDWLYQNREWITGSTFQNQKVIQNYTQTYDAKLTLEPIPDFKIDLELNKSFTEDYQESFKDTLIDNNRELVHLQGLVGGSMTVTYSALQTLFRSDTSELKNLFETFQSNQVIISQRLGTRPHSDINLARRGFTDGYGENQQDVIIPAFIAAYTDKDARTIDLNLFNILPKVNWRIQYDGLSKLPFFQEIFSNFTLSHSYRSTLTVGRYSSNTRFYEALPTNGGMNNDGNFFARIEIPEVAIQEAFSPLLGVEATLQNGMSFNLDYKKSRSLSLSSISKLLSERNSKEITAGFGYLIRDVDIPFLTGSKKKGSKKKKEEDDKKAQNSANNRNRGRGGQLQGRDLDIQCNFSLRDDITLARDLTPQGDSQPTRGNFALSLSPSVEYKLNRRLSLRLFFDYRKTIPKTSTGYPRTDASGGIVVRFELN